MEMLQKEGFLQENLLGMLRSKRSFRTFIYAIDKAGLTESFNGADQYTLFAPTDEAFRQLPHGTWFSAARQSWTSEDGKQRPRCKGRLHPSR
ncbi:fasciclin domain-containing protein [Pseudoxanthomonas sp. LjRoot143]|uniref:fasciclin domain-containing protein n=1 Tax=Pseudoxanthomonas sp. PXM01 TaxID=2769295 RepID=UPI001786D30B|nr:fasciclin domain-containing protein [Pseudoxanthomonas sp. PXM01]MBD9470300.1 fasciclin domain-containing protein [Pseudoxanthomonas sp. PXM01]